jgi:hypothetical protein
MRPFTAGPRQPVLVDVGDHLVDGRVVPLDVQDRLQHYFLEPVDRIVAGERDRAAGTGG